MSDDRHLTPDTQHPIRTFIAILLSDELKRRIGLAQYEFKILAPEVKWVAEENFHVTLKFLGNVKNDQIDRIAEALTEALSGVKPFEIEVSDVGAFPNVRRPRTIWTGITSGAENLVEVARLVDKRLEKLGFEREERPFRSHITIGRLKVPRGGKELGPAIEKAEVGSLGSVFVDSVAIMKSDLMREGPIYSLLSKIPFGGDGKGDAN